MTATTTTADRATVAFVCPMLDSGGAEFHWRDLIIAMHAEDVDVSLISLNATGRAFEQVAAAGVDVTCLDAPHGLRALGALRRLSRALPRGVDTVISWEPNAALLGALAARSASATHLINWHRGPNSQISRIQRLSLRVAGRLGARVIAVSRSQIDELNSLGFTPERITVIPNGTGEPEFATVSRTDARRELDLPQDAFICLLVGRLSAEKRVDRFIEGVRIAAAKQSNVIGIVIGDGPARPKLEALTTDPACNTTLRGFSDKPSLWMRAADVVCLSSDREALPVSLVEAAACGRPSIGPAIGGVGEVITNGVTGVVIDALTPDRLAASICELAADTNTADSMGSKALTAWRERFSHDQMVSRYMEQVRSGAPMTQLEHHRSTTQTP